MEGYDAEKMELANTDQPEDTSESTESRLVLSRERKAQAMEEFVALGGEGNPTEPAVANRTLELYGTFKNDRAPEYPSEAALHQAALEHVTDALKRGIAAGEIPIASEGNLDINPEVVANVLERYFGFQFEQNQGEQLALAEPEATTTEEPVSPTESPETTLEDAPMALEEALSTFERERLADFDAAMESASTPEEILAALHSFSVPQISARGRVWENALPFRTEGGDAEVNPVSAYAENISDILDRQAGGREKEAADRHPENFMDAAPPALLSAVQRVMRKQ